MSIPNLILSFLNYFTIPMAEFFYNITGIKPFKKHFFSWFLLPVLFFILFILITIKVLCIYEILTIYAFKTTLFVSFAYIMSYYFLLISPEISIDHKFNLNIFKTLKKPENKKAFIKAIIKTFVINNYGYSSLENLSSYEENKLKKIKESFLSIGVIVSIDDYRKMSIYEEIEQIEYEKEKLKEREEKLLDQLEEIGDINYERVKERHKVLIKAEKEFENQIEIKNI